MLGLAILMAVTMHRSLEVARQVREPMLLRFDRVERFAHWANATIFIVLMLTALPLYFVQVEAVVGRRELVAEIHTWAGIALPVPLLISLAGSWGSRVRGDVKQFSRWTQEEVKWLRSLGQDRILRMGKFNPGQKLNAIFTGSSIFVMFGSGFVLHWFGFFPLAWRTGATFVHDLFAAAIVVVFFGHISFALTHRDALRSMFTGRISEKWAAIHSNQWLEDQKQGLA